MLVNLKKNISKKWILVIVVTLVVVAAVGTTAWLLVGPSKKTSTTVPEVKTETTKPVTIESPQQDKIHISAMGDMLAHDTIIANAKTTTGYDFGAYFTNIRPAYKDSDVVFCNQEGLSAGETFGISGYPSFNAPKQFSAGLQSGAGCNLINLANNHMGDKGVDATNATIDVWNALKPLAYSGANKSAADQQVVHYAQVKNIKLALLSFADFNNNRATPDYSVTIYHDEALLRSLVTEARSNADLVIVSMHWGTEDSAVVNADQRAQVTLLASLGVDVIIGTGPHVLQKVDQVERPDGGKMTVWYSLGNMLSSQLNIDELVSGIAGFDVVKNTDKSISIENLSFIPTYMHYEWTAAQRDSNDYLARKNAMLYLLKDAEAPLSRSLFGTTVQAQQAYVSETLGPFVTIK